LDSADCEHLRRRQAELLRSDISIRPAPKSKSRAATNANSLTAAQVEELRRALIEAFRF
jgi:hypothetical protein